MDCRQVKAQLADLSADVLSPPAAAALHEHFAKCGPCECEWQQFQQTLLIISATLQPLPAPDSSRHMWAECAEHIYQKIEQQRLAGRKSPFVMSGLSRSPLQRAPWGWVALGGALATLGAVWWMTPQDTGVSAPGQAPSVLVRELDGDEVNPGTLVSFQPLPASAAGMVDHHSTMAFDPYTDHVGSTLVSYSANSSHP